ncbi:MAG: alpha/beta fold hydrolase [Anaerolineae bacterium]
MNDYDYQMTTINALSTAEQISGAGDAILYLHGWGANIGLIVPLAERLTRFGYRNYIVDLPGFGHSAPPSKAWTVYDYAQWVIAYLDTHRLEQVYLFGHSFGGRLGLILGAQYPQRIKKMVLSDAAGIKASTPLWLQIRLKSYQTMRDTLYQVGLTSLADRLRQAYNQRYGSSDFQQVSGVMRETFIHVVNEDLLPLASQVRVSTLLFWGDQDTDTPLWMGQKLEQAIPDAGLVVHAGAGHYAYLEQADETARVMHYFFTHD